MQKGNRKSVIIIGNGFSLKHTNFGKKIDEFDEVIRINDWKTRGWEDDAGTKTTIWGLYNPTKGGVNFINGYRRFDYSKEEILDIVSSVREIWYVCWKYENLNHSWKLNKCIKILKLYDRIKRHQSIEGSNRVKNIINPPTTGFNLIWTMTGMYDKVYLAGFDFAGTTMPGIKDGHYYGGKQLKDSLARDIHSPHLEYEEIKKLIKKGNIEYLTKKTNIIKGNFIGNKVISKQCECGETSNLYDWEQSRCHYCEKEI